MHACSVKAYNHILYSQQTILEIRSLRPREFKYLSQSHPASKRSEGLTRVIALATIQCLLSFQEEKGLYLRVEIMV